MTPQALIIRFDDYGSRFSKDGSIDINAMVALADELDGVLTVDGLGELDGYELADDGSVGTIYLYGADARAMYEAVKHIIDNSPVTRGGMAFLYFGDVADEATNVDEIEIGGKLA
jgi:hypothetical protein